MNLIDILADEDVRGEMVVIPRDKIHTFFSVYVIKVSGSKHIAFCRVNGTPVIYEESKENNCLYGVYIGWERYKVFINRLCEFLKSDISRYESIVTNWMKLTMDDMKKINSENWHNYVLPCRTGNLMKKMTTNDGIYNITVSELVRSDVHNFYAIWNGREIKTCFALENNFQNYVVNLTEEDNTIKSVDIRDLDDIYKKEFYITAQNVSFRVGLVSAEKIIVDCNYNINFTPTGFVSLDSRGAFGPGYEVKVELIESVYYKKISAYNRITDRLR